MSRNSATGEIAISTHTFSRLLLCTIQYIQSLNILAVNNSTKFIFFFLNDTATPKISTLPLHDPFPISISASKRPLFRVDDVSTPGAPRAEAARAWERGGADPVLAVTFGRAVFPDFT